MPKKLLLTGFEPFGKEKINPSGLAVRELNGNRISGVAIVGVELPVAFQKAGKLLQQSIHEVRPVAVISSGVAAGRSQISLERVAINVMDAPRGDNEGRKPRDEPILRDAPAAYFSTLPIRSIVRDLTRAGIPAAISNTAGTHLCNYSMYAGLHYVASENLRIPCGFIHLPQTPDQVVRRHGMPSMSLDTIVQALEIAAKRTLTQPRKT